jgi:CheY-like chemotaxis protein
MTTQLLQKTILIVDDNISVVGNMAKLVRLRMDNVKVITAHNGKDGYQKYLEYKPDIILTDMKMPVMSGQEMIDKIREKDKNVIIIAMSADESTTKTLHVGDVYKFFRKLGFQNLVTVLEECISELDHEDKGLTLAAIQHELSVFKNSNFIVDAENSRKLQDTINQIKSPEFFNNIHSTINEIESIFKKYGI